MRANEFTTEAATWGEKNKAHEQLTELFKRVYAKENNAVPIKDAEIQSVLQQAKSLLKVTGRAYKGWSYPNYSAGYMFDVIVTGLRKRLAKQGNNIFPDSPSTKGFARQLAAYYGGHTTWRNPTKWTREIGRAHV